MGCSVEAPVAQLVEQLTLNQRVLGSSPGWCMAEGAVEFSAAFFLARAGVRGRMEILQWAWQAVRHWIYCAAVILMIVAGQGAYGGAPASPPTTGAATKAAPGSIRGMLKLAEGVKVTRLIAVDRTLAAVEKMGPLGGTPPEGARGGGAAGGRKDDAIYEGAVGADGAFHVDQLLPGHLYDLIVWTRQGEGAAAKTVRWEGMTMDYHREVIASTEATAEDRKAIETLVTDVPTFYDKSRVLRIAADHQHATVLVEMIRTRDFDSNKGGEVIYRVELWYFENLFGGWAKDANTEKPLERLRGNPGAFPENWQFLAELGGLSPGGAEATITLPEKADAKRGLAGRVK